MIDIIIPCYNAKKTICDTLFSIMYQTFYNFNVYLVNDAGKENYDEEVEFFSNFFNIKEYRLKENRGPGFARDYGMKHSNSKYIVFIDSDDVLANPLSLEYLYNIISKKNDDFFVTAMSTNGCGFSSKHYGALHGKIFKREFIIKNNISFNYERYTSEDSSFIEMLLMFGAKQESSEYVSYILRNVNENSLMHKTVGDKRLIDFVFQTIWAIKEGNDRPNSSKDYLKYLTTFMGIYYYINCRNMKITDAEKKKIEDLKKISLDFYDEDKVRDEMINLVRNREEKESNLSLFKDVYADFKKEVFDKVVL